MAWFRKIKAGLVKSEITEYIGEEGNIFFNIETGELRLSDGSTPHGLPIAGGGGPGGGHVIQDEGVSLTQRPILDFTGVGVTVTDVPGSNKTLVTITADTTGLIKADGTVPFTGNVNMGGFEVTNAAEATADDSLVTRSQMETAIDSEHEVGITAPVDTTKIWLDTSWT